MFTKTLKFSDFKTNSDIFSEMNREDVFQIFHRGSDVKVMMTQEKYFQLISRIEKLEEGVRTEEFNEKKLLEEINLEIKSINDFIVSTKEKVEDVT